MYFSDVELKSENGRLLKKLSKLKGKIHEMQKGNLTIREGLSSGKVNGFFTFCEVPYPFVYI